MFIKNVVLTCKIFLSRNVSTPKPAYTPFKKKKEKKGILIIKLNKTNHNLINMVY